MPRKGRGEQAVRTQTGQGYGEAKAQEDAQRMQPLPQMPQPSPGGAVPGATPFSAPTAKPGNGDYGSASAPNMKIGLDDTERAKIASIYPVLATLANGQHVSRHLRAYARRAKNQIGDTNDFADKGL
tara:strand:- start:2013 stop:2393 length:381 start_codon:yes stop_codon:yes gene_type:complete